ncbi:hypothetical protein [Streptosporangium sp. NPDC003464]
MLVRPRTTSEEPPPDSGGVHRRDGRIYGWAAQRGVPVGMNAGGLWFSGADAPWLSDWDRMVFATCRPSYHMRQNPVGQWALRAVPTVESGN